MDSAECPVDLRKISSLCGYKNDTLTLKDRVWTCPECGAVHQRDLLAASNILRQGIAE